MLKRNRSNPRQRPLRRSPVALLLLLLLWSLLLGWGMAIALDFNVAQAQSPSLENQPQVTIGTVDPVPSAFQLGQELYLKNCSQCHIAIPPAVLPTGTWRRLLQDEQHYGQNLQRLTSPSIILVWNYLQMFSRPEQDKEAIPYRVRESRYFKALHPQVEFSESVRINGCITCHSGARDYNFR